MSPMLGVVQTLACVLPKYRIAAGEHIAALALRPVLALSTCLLTPDRGCQQQAAHVVPSRLLLLLP